MVHSFLTGWTVEEMRDLQGGAVDDLHVNNQFAALVVDDQGADGTTTIGEGFGDPGPEVGLIDDGDALLDITRLGHGDD